MIGHTRWSAADQPKRRRNELFVWEEVFGTSTLLEDLWGWFLLRGELRHLRKANGSFGG